MAEPDEKLTKRFEKLESMLWVVVGFGLMGLLVILAAYLMEYFKLDSKLEVNLYYYSAIPFSIAVLVLILFFFLWLFNYKEVKPKTNNEEE